MCVSGYMDMLVGGWHGRRQKFSQGVQKIVYFPAGCRRNVHSSAYVTFKLHAC